MQQYFLVLFATCALLSARPASDDKDAIATVQRLFDAMEAHNAEAARAVFVPDAALIAVHANGDVSNSTSDQFVTRLGAAKEPWLERMWDPKVLVHGGLAEIWAEYDFHLNGQFSHCGVDSVTLVKTGGQWKISGIAYTMETSGCAGSPLGSPKK